MTLQLVLPNESRDLTTELLVRLVRDAEELGYGAAWLPDHVLPPQPYGDVFGGVYEPLVTLAHLAAVTSRILLGTSVLILPLREPFLAAKQFATLDRLSGQRFVLGVGTGWNAAEFDEIGADFASRGARTDEILQIVRQVTTTGRGPKGGYFEPRLPRPLPLLVGGHSTRALRRAADVGSYWQSAELAPPDFAAAVARLRELPGGDRVTTIARMRWADADLQSAVRLVNQLRGAGADQVAVHCGPLDGYGDRMRLLAQHV
ncbi:LLM class F420-dependent oxidoreductase [Mycobacterium sp. MS1601]|uniref:TIGR03619 family F420-dependent LLM class oxidoreductase n=1 Tax=Mycobacterium sp. MS1601 TaxID=1936029 RepID=UPI0009793986|nr:TIGR03619 family F420-dependent LLM class oxidoreductase [Mycobacterium sp. MS1601]AQA01895.1 LLM class F420-dependent oxidoreductase [Mycobacterium sp. MS1601]